jgi:hypothetical protein
VLLSGAACDARQLAWCGIHRLCTHSGGGLMSWEPLALDRATCILRRLLLTGHVSLLWAQEGGLDGESLWMRAGLCCGFRRSVTILCYI